jgi:hypothetical protein
MFQGRGIRQLPPLPPPSPAAQLQDLAARRAASCADLFATSAALQAYRCVDDALIVVKSERPCRFSAFHLALVCVCTHRIGRAATGMHPPPARALLPPSTAAAAVTAATAAACSATGYHAVVHPIMRQP